MRVVIAGGGTAGHVNPAIALARALEGAEVTFVGTAGGAEAQLVPAAGFPLERIHVRGFDRARPATLPAVAWAALRGARQAGRILARIDPRVVVGVGGYVSLPVGLAAALRRTPLVIHEQNAVLGLANKVLRIPARRVALSFEESRESVGPRAVVTGNPIAREIAHADRSRERERALATFGLEGHRKTLLAFGGSQGAQRINSAAAELSGSWSQRGDLQILHICGRAAYPELSRHAEARAEGAGIYRLVAFVDRMIEAYSVADLAVCRGGATTIAELCAVGVPAIVVPYPHHRDRQQERHGRILEAAGAAAVVNDSEATGQRIASEAEACLADESGLKQMREAALALGRPDAAERLAALVREVAGVTGEASRVEGEDQR